MFENSIDFLQILFVDFENNDAKVPFFGKRLSVVENPLSFRIVFIKSSESLRSKIVKFGSNPIC